MIKVTRIGFLNFWLYDDEEFDFYDGKLLLRGHNGSGKSVTMQSFIPLILDGNKAPSRLDPFGTTDKHIEDYLLGGVDTERKDEATAYLYMETYHQEKEKYITVGMGLHAKNGKPVDFWGFSIEDGRRIGKDIFLYEQHGEKVPLTKNQLKLVLGSENQLVEKIQEYKIMVNKLLFGFSSLDTYDEFINVLLQLRSPKLSKDYKPTKLMNILSSVLQPLTEADLSPLSDAIEEMDKTKEKIAKLEDDSKQLSYFLKTFTNYNEILLYQKAKNYLDSKQKQEEVLQALEENSQQIHDKNQSLEEKQKENADLEVELARLNRKRENIDDKDLNNKTQRRDNLQFELEKDKQKQMKLEQDVRVKQDREQDKSIIIKNLEDELYTYERNSLQFIKEIESICEDIKFTEPSIALKDLKQDKTTNVDFDYLGLRIKKHQQILKDIKEKLSNKKIKEQTYNSIEENVSKLDKQYQTLLEQMEEIEDRLESLLRDVKDEILKWNTKNTYIKISEEEKKEIFAYLKVYDRNSYQSAQNFYQKIAEQFLNTAREEKEQLIAKMSIHKNKKQQLEQELQMIEQKEEEEIILDEEQIKTREYLTTNHIPYLEFYKAIDFKDNVSSSTKDQLEQLLLTSGILSANIIRKKDISRLQGHKGLFLTSSSKKKKNLTQYFIPTNHEILTREEITAVLESISIDELDPIYLSEATFKMDYLIGFASSDIPSKYIGLLKRKEEKLRQIDLQKRKIEEVGKILDNIEQLLNKKNDEIATIIEESKRFPSEELLLEEENKRNQLDFEATRIAEQKTQEEAKQQVIMKEMEVLEQDLANLKKDIFLPLTYEAFEEALENSNQLLEILPKLKSEVTLYHKQNEMKNSHLEQIKEIQEDIATLYEDLHELSQTIKKNEAEKMDLDEILNSDKYKDMAKELSIIHEKLIRIPKRREELSIEIGALRENIKSAEEKAISLTNESKEKEEICKLLETFFLEEYHLHYVSKEEKDTAFDLAKFVINLLSNRKDSDMKNALQNYYSAFNEYRLNLNDYSLSQIDIFDNIPENTPYLEYYQNNRRNDVRAMYQGKKLNVYELSEAMMNSIEENNLIMTEQDRKLFEEILLNTIGNKIKERIIASENWVKQINQIMANVQKDSALSFGLIWKNKDAETMEEMDTKELVRVFKNPEGSSLGQDTQKLIKHFRSKLKRMMEYNGDTANYASIIFDVLDYRNWFEFKMTYQRAGDSKKELTDKVFSIFSGGEKAKTMYIPLFAAVSSKLNGANPHTLRLVALDEAFAGVDEKNIKELFGILSSLKLDYILTSQALTGDYDNVQELAIAELVRPNNSQTVAIRRKKWNGKNMEIILRKEITKDAIELF